MIKFSQCIKARSELSTEEFRRHWKLYREEARALADAIGAHRLAVSTTLNVEANLQLMMVRGTGLPFDAMVEVWFDHGQDLENRLAQPEAASAVKAMQAHQKEFVDLARSSFFFSSDEILTGE